MDIIGTVISVDKDKAVVGVKRASACGENCANCHGGCETTTATAVVQNTVGAGIGDMVKIQSDSGAVIKAAVVLYMLPVLVAIIAAVVAYCFGLGSILTVFIWVVAFFASFFVIKRFEKRLAPKSYITKVLGKGVK
ncbi:MAG: SoxR reducing system RseC family protein [Clostridia bacterium]|nr:SoxR reducing system RseC family protein [Clostridia bacterium]